MKIECLAEYRVLKNSDSGLVEVRDYNGKYAPKEISKVIIKHFKNK